MTRPTVAARRPAWEPPARPLHAPSPRSSARGQNTAPASPFDAEAATYDAREAADPFLQRLRERSLAHVLRAFPDPCRLLDVGAGTGTEAIALARMGYEVEALEPSRAMRARLIAKATEAGVTVPVHALTARQAHRLGRRHDGAYSSFGALSLEPHLQAAARSLARAMRPGGVVVATLLARWPLVEIAGNLARLRPRRAFRRAPGTDLWQGVPVRYATKASAVAAFSPWFDCTRWGALNMVGPSAVRALPDVLGLRRAARALDEATHRIPGLRALGDHVVCEFRLRHPD